MAHVPFGLAASMLLLLAPLNAFGQPVPDGLSVEWQGKKPCEKLYEDAQILIVRCTIPPGGKHVKHFHPGFSSYVLSGGKAGISGELRRGCTGEALPPAQPTAPGPAAGGGGGRGAADR